jgi:hypothetical protein
MAFIVYRTFLIVMVIALATCFLRQAHAQTVPDPCVRDYALGLYRKGEPRMV